MSDYCDVCKADQIVAPDGEHLCGLDALEAFSLGQRRGMNQSNQMLEAELRERMYDELARERRRMQELSRVARVVKKGRLFNTEMEILEVDHSLAGIAVVVR